METSNPVRDLAFNANDLLPKFWSIVQASLSDAVKKGELRSLDLGVYQGDERQIAAFHADLDKRLSNFSENL